MMAIGRGTPTTTAQTAPPIAVAIPAPPSQTISVYAVYALPAQSTRDRAFQYVDEGSGLGIG
jgi:hypothetical protein